MSSSRVVGWLAAGTWLLAAATVALAFLAGRPRPAAAFTARTSRETVYRVVDGDTLQLSTREKIRLTTIDAPELAADGGPASREALRKLVAGRVLTVEREGFDPYGRTLARLYLPDGREVGAAMVGEGRATPWPGR